MTAVHHWSENYPRRLREAYVGVLGMCWVIVAAIIGIGKVNQLRLPHPDGNWPLDGNAAVVAETIPYHELRMPASINPEQYVVEAPVSELGEPLAVVENAGDRVPLPVRDELAEAATMTPNRIIGGPAGPPGSGTGVPVVILPEPVKPVYDDTMPAPATDFRRRRADQMPEPLRDVSPEYPERARALSIEGRVALDLWLRKDGTVSVVQINRSSGSPLLDSAAVRAAARSTFKPARNDDGTAVNIWVRRDYTFSLAGR